MLVHVTMAPEVGWEASKRVSQDLRTYPQKYGLAVMVNPQMQTPSNGVVAYWVMRNGRHVYSFWLINQFDDGMGIKFEYYILGEHFRRYHELTPVMLARSSDKSMSELDKYVDRRVSSFIRKVAGICSRVR